LCFEKNKNYIRPAVIAAGLVLATEQHSTLEQEVRSEHEKTITFAFLRLQVLLSYYFTSLTGTPKDAADERNNTTTSGRTE
jgi:hypothetical protein